MLITTIVPVLWKDFKDNLFNWLNFLFIVVPVDLFKDFKMEYGNKIWKYLIILMAIIAITATILLYLVL